MAVPDYSVVLQTALNGRSAALGFASACGYLLKAGLLVPALPVSWQTNKSYCLVTPMPLIENSTVYDLRQWLLQRNASCMQFLDSIQIHQ
jgi:DNA-binding transcriptional LysR family regulator